jgi:hypothetical protein
MVRRVLSGIELGATTMLIVAVLVGIRALLIALGFDGMASTALSTGIIAGAIFVMGLVLAGTLADYKDAERAPIDLAAGLHALLREGESMHAAWGKPDLSELRRRLIAVVTSLRIDIDAGDSRTAQAAVEELSETFLELEDTDVPANYIVRQRSEQAGLRKSLLRIYHLQREEFLPSAYAMIVTLVGLILILLLLTDFGGTAESLVAVGFLSFFFLALLRLLNVISTPFKAGQERTDDDVSLSCSASSSCMRRRKERWSSRTSKLSPKTSKSSWSRRRSRPWIRPRPQIARRHSWLATSSRSP